MKAPEKIYIHRTIHLGLLSASEIDITGQDEQYIRKNALMEWAKETYKATENNNEISELFKQGALFELHKVINKIESL